MKKITLPSSYLAGAIVALSVAGAFAQQATAPTTPAPAPTQAQIDDLNLQVGKLKYTLKTAQTGRSEAERRLDDMNTDLVVANAQTNETAQKLKAAQDDLAKAKADLDKTVSEAATAAKERDVAKAAADAFNKTTTDAANALKACNTALAERRNPDGPASVVPKTEPQK